MWGAALILALAGCGGGGSGTSDAGAYAVAVGLSNTPDTTATPTPAPTPTAAPAAFVNGKWVDFQNGDDNNDGLSKAKAWKHSPGDPNATGVAGAYKPVAGDQIVFAAGSRYHGRIVAQFVGSSSQPVVLTSESADNPAVIDGTDFTALAKPCASQAACQGIAAWQKASVAVFKDPLPLDAVFFAGNAMLTPAQWPDPADLFYASELSNMADVAGTAIATGAIPVPASVGAGLASADSLRVAVWVEPNVVEERAATGVVSNVVKFDASGLKPYLDRMDKFALRGHSSLVSIAGEFAIMPDRKTVLFVTNSPVSAITAATGRSGIDVSGASNVVVRGLAFENFSDNDGNIRSGLPVWALRMAASNITVENNRFNNLFLTNGQGAITMQKTTGLTIRGNTIRGVAHGSGMRLSTGSSNIVVERNLIERVGRTAIYLADTDNSLILRNRIRDVFGVHGNGISVYLGSRGTKVIANTVTEAVRPVTIKGNGTKTPAANDILFANNLLVTTKDSLGAFISWGANGDNIRLHNNVILGAAKGSVRLDSDDLKLTIRRNVIDGITYNGSYLSSWTITDNAFRSLGVFQNQYTSATLVSGLATPQFTETGVAPTDLAQFCPHISETLDVLLGTKYDRHIGADFVCA